MSSPYIIRIVIHTPDTRTLESHDMINGDAFDDVPAEIRKILTERTDHVVAMIADHCADEAIGTISGTSDADEAKGDR